jgi:hypothetical protein
MVGGAQKLVRTCNWFTTKQDATVVCQLKVPVDFLDALQGNAHLTLPLSTNS